MKEIALTQGKVALVSDRDYEDLSQFKWFAHCGRNTFYAARKVQIKGKPYMEPMHRRILSLEKGDRKVTDHINRNGLDNRNNNLRICTNAENGQNRKRQRNNTSGFQGVYWNRQNKKWRAKLKVNSVQKDLGCFDSKIDAAMAYNAGAIKYHGEFATLNKIGKRIR